MEYVTLDEQVRNEGRQEGRQEKAEEVYKCLIEAGFSEEKAYHYAYETPKSKD